MGPGCEKGEAHRRRGRNGGLGEETETGRGMGQDKELRQEETRIQRHAEAET